MRQPIDSETRSEILDLARRWASLASIYVRFDEDKVVSGDPRDAHRDLAKLVDESHGDYIAACRKATVCAAVTCWDEPEPDRDTCRQHLGTMSNPHNPPRVQPA